MGKLSTVVLIALLASGWAQKFYDDYGPEPVAPRRAAAPSRFQSSFAEPREPITPVPILKQINRHNEDGSYTYGYEGADGAFKIETKLPTGEVKGKYGFVDDTGKVRVVEYGANKYGFQPTGEGITVAPPTLVDETLKQQDPKNREFVDNGQYYDQLDPEPAPAPVPARAPIQSRPRPRPQPQYVEDDFPPQRNPGPLPVRASIPGGAPTTIDFGPPPSRPSKPQSLRPSPSFSFAEPAPVDEDVQYSEPAPPSRPRIQFGQAPAAAARAPPPPPPEFAPAPRPAPRPSSGGRSSGGVLDQLARDYALPQGGAPPLHDISFGYY